MTLRTYHTAQRAQHIREHLTDLDMAIIETLATVTYASTRQIEALTLPAAPTPARARRIRRRLAHLAHLKVTYQLRRPIGGLGGGSRGSVWTLERTGYTLAHSQSRRDLRPARERGQAFLEHSLAVTQHRVDLERYGRRHGLRVASWIGEPASRIPYHDPATGRLVHLTPDAVCEVHAPTETIISALEVDRSSEGRTSLERKAARYLAYAARHPDSPQIVWTFMTAERAAMFTDAVDRSFGQPGVRDLLNRGLFIVTTTEHSAAALSGEIHP
jgi:hypothetical protein